MYPTLLIIHSVIRYVVLILLVTLLVRSLMGWTGKKAFTATDNKVSLFTLISTHTQALFGFLLYFIASPFVKFSGEFKQDATIRYWTMEHITMMLVAVILITVARSTSKKLTDDTLKHRRLFILNLLALIIIFVSIMGAKRGFFSITM